MTRGIGRQLSHEVLENYRFRALELRKKGWTVRKISEAFGVNRRAVTRWLALWKQRGKKALKSKKAPGPAMKIQEKEVRRLLCMLKQSGTDFGFETPLWTCKRVRYLIEKKLKKKLHATNVWRLLKRFGLTNQKPERRALEQNPREAKRWLREEWPKIQEHARRWQAMLYFQDEAGVSLTAVLGKTWAPKGKTPVVRVTGNKGGFCVSSAISPGGRLLFRIEKGKVNADKFIDFLSKIMVHHKNRKVIVVTDRAPVHTAGKVSAFVERHGKRFVVYYLPPYSPELNPDESVWAHLKEHKLKTHQAQTVGQLKALTLAGMRSIQMRPFLVQSFFMPMGYK